MTSVSPVSGRTRRRASSRGQALPAKCARAEARLGDCPVYIPSIDSAFELSATGPVDISASTPLPRIDPATAGHRDWNNDYQTLLQDLTAQLRKAAGDKSRGVIIRRIRRAMEGAEP